MISEEMFFNNMIADRLSLGKVKLTWENLFSVVILRNYFTYNHQNILATSC